MFSKANQAFRDGRYEEAIAAYEAAIQKRPDFYIYHENLALTLERCGRTEEAIQAYRRTLNLRGDSVFSLEALKRLEGSSPAASQRSEIRKSWEDPEPVRLMRQVTPVSEDELREEYIASGLDKVPDTFGLYRIIGNDLYPRHAKGQSRSNVEFILKNEAELPLCQKRWILNRIFDADERRSIVSLLKEHNQTYYEIPFSGDEFRKIGWDLSTYPHESYLISKEFLTLPDLDQSRAYTAAYRRKNNYLMNNNGARNYALELGRREFKWVLPFDGNCFITESAWDEFIHSVCSIPYRKYFVIPMQRVTNNEELLRDDFCPCPVEEPQIAFRRDASERFDERHPYGRRPKVELFWRLGVPGPWDKWRDDPWELPRPEVSKGARTFGVAGWVARLNSGQAQLEISNRESFKNRGRLRELAIKTAINHVSRSLCRKEGELGLVFYSEDRLAALRGSKESDLDARTLEVARAELLERASAALARKPGSVVDKTEVPPGGCINDYYHPAPYWWPNPDTSDGLPYVRRDGIRSPGTVMYSPESDRYDRTRLQQLFDDGINLAFAWLVTGDSRYAKHAVAQMERWFVDPSTKMTPHLRFAQVRPGHNNNEGHCSGIIEFKDIYYYLDAVRVLESSGQISSSSVAAFRSWLREYLDWLVNSSQGIEECRSSNNHGTFYDLQVAAIASYIGDDETVYRALIRARGRIGAQFSPVGWQHSEMKRTQTAHYCCFNLQGWMALAILAKRYGDSLIRHRSESGGSLQAAVNWLIQHSEGDWPYQQIDTFDRDRPVPLFFLAKGLGLSLGVNRALEDQIERISKSRAVFDCHDGVIPYWAFAGVCPADKARGQYTSNGREFLHVVVMRFGIGIFDEVWLRHRFGLLSSVAVPSLRNQVWAPNSRFLVQIDERLPEPWVDRLSSLFQGLPFVIQKLQLHIDRGERLLEFCTECASSEITHFVTTRMDDDDALSRNALSCISEAVQDALNRGIDSCAIGIRTSIRYLAARNVAVKLNVPKPDANGASVLFPRGERKTVYSWSHKNLPSEFCCESKPFIWLEEAQAKCLYLFHRMSDSDYLERENRILKNKNSYSFKESDYHIFGIDLELLDNWRRLDAVSPTLSSTKTTELLSRIELMIRKERRHLEKRSLCVSDELERLLEERVRIGSFITSSLAADRAAESESVC